MGEVVHRLYYELINFYFKGKIMSAIEFCMLLQLITSQKPVW